MLLTSCVNTPIDHSVFRYLRALVARCSASCVNWTLSPTSYVPFSNKKLPHFFIHTVNTHHEPTHTAPDAQQDATRALCQRQAHATKTKQWVYVYIIGRWGIICKLCRVRVGGSGAVHDNGHNDNHGNNRVTGWLRQRYLPLNSKNKKVIVGALSFKA